MELFFPVLAWSGAGVLLFRLWPRSASHQDISQNPTTPMVSIIVPARNEEHNLPRLLDSLTRLNYPSKEIIVVDDHSTDRTAEIARSYPVRVLSGHSLPPGWNGKNWVCHQAAQEAKGDILLFTDADTDHASDGLTVGVNFFLSSNADMISALPYHRCPTWWEKCLGPFQALVLTATNVYRPRHRRLFAIGMYLMFSRESYHKQGGHAAVWSQYPDDLTLANMCFKTGGRYLVYTRTPLFSVRMYSHFVEFVQGWRRNFLAGIQQSNWTATPEIFLTYAGFSRLFSLIIILPLIAWRQKSWGEFSFLGVILFPMSLFLHSVITTLALFDYLTGNRLVWKGRTYQSWTGQTVSGNVPPSSPGSPEGNRS